jgi:hypothetical protein
LQILLSEEQIDCLTRPPFVPVTTHKGLFVLAKKARKINPLSAASFRPLPSLQLINSEPAKDYNFFAFCCCYKSNTRYPTMNPKPISCETSEDAFYSSNQVSLQQLLPNVFSVPGPNTGGYPRRRIQDILQDALSILDDEEAIFEPMDLSGSNAGDVGDNQANGTNEESMQQ